MANKTIRAGAEPTLYLTISAVIAALYVVFTLPFAQFAYGPLQFRLAEILVVLPILTPAAVPGLTLGCFLANLLNPENLGLVDIIFGSLATFLAAICTRYISGKKPFGTSIKTDATALVPPVLINAVIVGGYLALLLVDGPVNWVVMGTFMLQVGVSEGVLVYALGLPFLLAIRKSNIIKQLPRRV